MVCIVTTKLSAVRIDEKPVMNTPNDGQNHVAIRVSCAVRGIECPARIHTPSNKGTQGEQTAQGKDIPTQQVEAREGEIPCPDHHGHQEIAQHGGNRRDQKKEDHDDAVHGEQLVVGLRLHQVALRRHQLKPYQGGSCPSDKEEKSNRDEV